MITAFLASYGTDILRAAGIICAALTALFVVRQSGKAAGAAQAKTQQTEQSNENLRETIRQRDIVRSGSSDDWMQDTRLRDALRDDSDSTGS